MAGEGTGTDIKFNGDEDEVTKFVLNKYKKLKGQRENWENHWQEIIQLVNPRKDTIWNRSRGEKRQFRVYDSTAIHANELLAAALHSRLTNPSVQWFSMTSGDPKLDDQKAVREYFQEVTQIMHETMNNSNFQTQVAEMYMDLTAINTAVLAVDEDDQDDIRFRCNPIWEHYIDENHKKQVDTVFTEYEMTMRQVIQKYGKKVFDTEQLRFRAESFMKDPSKKFTVVHAVFPKKDLGKKVNLKGLRGKKYASVEILMELNVKLSQKGFFENPYIVSRFTVNSGEKYGRGPGMKSLPDNKMLQEMMKVTIKVGQKAADPPLLAPDDGAVLPIQTTPGSINYYRAGTDDRISYLESRSRPDISFQMIEATRMQIKQAFYVDQLQLLERGPQMTATEVDTRNEERMSLLSPILARQHHEFLKPLIDRVFNILERKDKFPEPPEALDGKKAQIQYSSQIAKAQKRSLITALQTFYNSIVPVIELDPNTAKVVDGIKAAHYIADVLDIPSKVLNSQEQANEMVQVEQQQQQQAIQQQQQLQQSQVAKNLEGPIQAAANVPLEGEA